MPFYFYDDTLRYTSGAHQYYCAWAEPTLRFVAVQIVATAQNPPAASTILLPSRSGRAKLSRSEERCDEEIPFRQARIINTALTLLFS
jgi:hypothetical protein